MDNHQISAHNLLIIKKYLALVNKAEYEKRCIAKRKTGMSYVSKTHQHKFDLSKLPTDTKPVMIAKRTSGIPFLVRPKFIAESHQHLASSPSSSDP